MTANTRSDQGPGRTSCASCGARWHREGDAFRHSCPPNHTGFTPGDTVRVGGVDGQVIAVSRGAVEVYFRQSLQAHWYAASQLEAGQEAS